MKNLKCTLLNFFWRIKLFFLKLKYGKYSNACAISDPIHDWFELSYAQYLTIPRSILQSMPIKWQRDFVKCLEDLDNHFEWRPTEGRYWVKLKNGSGRYVSDPFMEYRHAPDYTPEEVKKLRGD